MFEMKGKYGEARVYASLVENACLDQIRTFMNSPVVEGCSVAIMPDTHAGKGACIGFTQTLNGRVNPSMVGVDIGCGMLVVRVAKSVGDDLFGPDGLRKFDEIMHTKIPSGHNSRESLHEFAGKIDVRELIVPVNHDKELYSIGTLGGGNHFVEIDKDGAGDYYVVIHSGSRHLGLTVANRWEENAIRYHSGKKSKDKSDLIAKLRREGREREIESALGSMSPVIVAAGMSYLEGELLEGYLHDMKIAQRFAELNREAMMNVIVSEMGIAKRHVVSKFCTMHNYIDIDAGILRKGAISLKSGEIAIIPMNMSDGSLIVRGKGNPDWNFSGPHGAGRIMSRSAAKKNLSMDDFMESMKGVYTSTATKDTLDESKMAYKPAEIIMKEIGETCDIVDTIKPIYNFKAAC